MVDETLRRLLDAETEAELIVARAVEERNAIIEEGKRDVHLAEQQHTEQIAKIQASLLAIEAERVQQTISTMQRHYAEQALALRTSAKLNELQAIADAVALLTVMGAQ